MTDCVNIKYILLNELNADLKKLNCTHHRRDIQIVFKNSYKTKTRLSGPGIKFLIFTSTYVVSGSSKNILYNNIIIVNNT